MPISVLCPSCDAPVNAPDSAAGKRAKCPKCQEVMILPGGEEGFEVVEEPATKTKSKPRVRVEEDDADERPSRKSRRKDEEDDEGDDEEDDERPKRKSSRRVVAEDDRPSKKPHRRDEADERRRKKGAAKAGNSKGLWMGVRIAVMIAVGVGVYFALRDKDDAPDRKDPDAAVEKPIDWVSFQSPDGSFSTVFPMGAPSAETFEELLLKSPSGPGVVDREAVEKFKTAGHRWKSWLRTHGNRDYRVVKFEFDVPELMGQYDERGILRIVQVALRKKEVIRINHQNPISMGDLTGIEFQASGTKQGWTMSHIISRGSGNTKLLFMLSIDSPEAPGPKDPDTVRFFEGFRFTK